MKFKRSRSNILIRTILVFASLFLAAYGLAKELYYLDVIVVPILVFQFIDYYRFHKKAQEEIEQFVEAVHYRDFSRYFDVKKAPAELQPFRTGFNEINSTFKLISKEKETQYLHLKTILEIVDTGILSYELESGEILWMNESLKSLLLIPYLKTIYSLEKRNKELYTTLQELNPQSSVITTLTKNNNSYKILLSATMFKSDSKKYKLIAFQNINQAVDETESKAWQRLLSVMTHELMNSVAPISSLAETLKTSIHENINQPSNSKELLTDIETGISTIQKRSEGLLKFTEVYRNLSKITHATVSSSRVMELFEHVQQLMQPTLDKKKIDLEVLLRDPYLEVEADTNLIEQVLINLVLNAIEAVKDRNDPKISLSGEKDQNEKIVLKVADNGAGIPMEMMDKIFIPFFSTKKNGSGIGLSLCKQIMVLHHGNIQVQSHVDEGTVFTLNF